jgi:hypothetical protein
MKNEQGKAVAIEELIHVIRGKKVILDSDLARIYGVPTKRFNQQVKRNRARFPEDFLFQLTRAEAVEVLRLRSQIVTLKTGDKNLRSQNATSRAESVNLRSQIVTSSLGYGGRRYLPYAFTEHGAVMAANVLNSPAAVQMSVFVVRAFVSMRALLVEHKELFEILAELEKKLTERLDAHDPGFFDRKIRPEWQRGAARENSTRVFPALRGSPKFFLH